MEDFDMEKVDALDLAWECAHYMTHKLERVFQIGKYAINQYKETHDSLAPRSVLVNLSKDFEEKLTKVLMCVIRTQTLFMRSKCNILMISHSHFMRQGLEDLYTVLIEAFWKMDGAIYEELCKWKEDISKADIVRWSKWRRENGAALRRHYKSASNELDIIYNALKDAKYLFDSFNYNAV
jgi:hypothetical protein